MFTVCGSFKSQHLLATKKHQKYFFFKYLEATAFYNWDIKILYNFLFHTQSSHTTLKLAICRITIFNFRVFHDTFWSLTALL